MTNEAVCCPTCGGKAVNITLHGDARKKFLCTANVSHEFEEGDSPEPPEEALSVDEVADAIAERVAQKIQRPSLGEKIRSLFG